MAPARGASRLCCGFVLAPLALGAFLVLAADAADAGVGRRSVAVVALGRCDDPASAIGARAFRALLAARLGPVLQSEVDTATPIGGLATRTLGDLGHAVTEARAEFYKGRVSTAVTHLEGLSQDVIRLPPSDAR